MSGSLNTFFAAAASLFSVASFAKARLALLDRVERVVQEAHRLAQIAARAERLRDLRPPHLLDHGADAFAPRSAARFCSFAIDALVSGRSQSLGLSDR